MTKKIVSCLCALVLLLGCVFPAAALEIHIDNSQALGGSLALRYLRTDGVWVTKGWVNFGPHSKQTVTLETWEPVFYLHVEVGGGASVELPGEKHRFWVVRDVFEPVRRVASRRISSRWRCGGTIPVSRCASDPGRRCGGQDSTAMSVPQKRQPFR